MVIDEMNPTYPMRIFKTLQAFTCLFLLVGVALAQELPLPVADALARAGIPFNAVGIYVQDVTAGKPVFMLNPALPFNPASTMKLVTTDAALELLGPTFSWKTQAYVTGSQTGDVLQGDLIIKGGGDPKLVIENFWLFLRRIRAAGIREIRGNLLLDRSVFEQGSYDPALFDGEPLKPYNAGPDGLLLNYKAISFIFQPDEASGLVKVTTDPPIADYPVTGPRLTNGDCGDWHGKLQPAIEDRSARFSGSFSAACGEKSWYMHPYLMSHAQYFGAVFRQMWRDAGGVFKGEVKNGMLPADARLIAEWQSPALSEVIRDINKYSNNVMARQLLLTLATDIYQRPGNPERGASVIKGWLHNKGIDVQDVAVDNGSGLSRMARIPAGAMGKMLVAAFRSPTMPEFISSMPLVGYDGTMRRRLTTRGIAGNAHVKTGSLDDVRSVAGYVLAASGRRYAVVCLINHANAARGQAAQDALLQWVYERG